MDDGGWEGNPNVPQDPLYGGIAFDDEGEGGLPAIDPSFVQVPPTDDDFDFASHFSGNVEEPNIAADNVAIAAAAMPNVEAAHHDPDHIDVEDLDEMLDNPVLNEILEILDRIGVAPHNAPPQEVAAPTTTIAAAAAAQDVSAPTITIAAAAASASAMPILKSPTVAITYTGEDIYYHPLKVYLQLKAGVRVQVEVRPKDKVEVLREMLSQAQLEGKILPEHVPGPYYLFRHKQCVMLENMSFSWNNNVGQHDTIQVLWQPQEPRPLFRQHVRGGRDINVFVSNLLAGNDEKVPAKVDASLKVGMLRQNLFRDHGYFWTPLFYEQKSTGHVFLLFDDTERLVWLQQVRDHDTLYVLPKELFMTVTVEYCMYPDDHNMKKNTKIRFKALASADVRELRNLLQWCGDGVFPLPPTYCFRYNKYYPMDESKPLFWYKIVDEGPILVVSPPN